MVLDGGIIPLNPGQVKRIVAPRDTWTSGPEKLTDGKFAASKLSATCVFDRHESIALMGELQGEKLVGTFQTEGREGKWEATRPAKASGGI